MPKVHTGQVELFYTEAGAGPPLVLIAGLGFWRWQWFKQVPAFSRYFRVVTFDNRGVGDSDQPDTPFQLTDMADDVAGLVDVLEAAPAHVLGFSMGGSIAMELALRHPDRVRSLVLVGTSPGGAERVPAAGAQLDLLQPDPALDHRGNMLRAMPLLTAPGYWAHHPEERDQVLDMRLQRPTPYASFHRQLAASRGWAGLGDRAAALDLPVLVVHGDSDGLVPVANGRQLADRIPGAQLVVLPGAGHLPFIEAAPMFNRVVLEFLQSV